MTAKKPPPRPEMGGVTRIDIVTELGRYTFWGDSWRYDEQDDGRTLKLFAKGEGKQAQAELRAALLSGPALDDEEHR